MVAVVQEKIKTSADGISSTNSLQELHEKLQEVEKNVTAATVHMA